MEDSTFQDSSSTLLKSTIHEIAHLYVLRFLFLKLHIPTDKQPVKVLVDGVVPVTHPAFKGAEADALLTWPHPKVIHSHMTSEDVERVDT